MAMKVRYEAIGLILQMNDFIVPDHEVEESADEESKEGEAKKKHRKHHRQHRIKELDDEDFELIQDNTGQEIKKKKRLQKVADREKDGESGLVKRDLDEEDEELDERYSKQAAEEPIDASSRKRLIAPANRRSIDENTKAAQKAHKIFEDLNSLEAKAKLTRKVGR